MRIQPMLNIKNAQLVMDIEGNPRTIALLERLFTGFLIGANEPVDEKAYEEVSDIRSAVGYRDYFDELLCQQPFVDVVDPVSYYLDNTSYMRTLWGALGFIQIEFKKKHYLIGHPGQLSDRDTCRMTVSINEFLRQANTTLINVCSAKIIKDIITLPELANKINPRFHFGDTVKFMLGNIAAQRDVITGRPVLKVYG